MPEMSENAWFGTENTVLQEVRSVDPGQQACTVAWGSPPTAVSVTGDVGSAGIDWGGIRMSG